MNFLQYVGVFLAVAFWTFALTYLLQTMAALFSVYSKNGVLTSVKAHVFVARSIYTAALSVAGLAALHLTGVFV